MRRVQRRASGAAALFRSLRGRRVHLQLRHTVMTQLSRRTFLGAAAGAATVAASPWFWVKKSFAQSTPGFGSAKHVLILYAAGGLRSTPLFNADASFQHNPFGRANSTAEWGVGNVLGT